MVAVSEIEVKGYVAYNVATWGSCVPIHCNGFSPSLPIPSFLSPDSLSVYIEYNEQLFPETRSGVRRHTTTGLGEESERDLTRF